MKLKELEAERVHVMPVGDMRDHSTSVLCWCEPRLDGLVVIHNSFDQREKFESGERLPS